MNSNKKYCGNWKKASQLIILCESEAIVFLSSHQKREKILEYIANPREQLELCSDNENYYGSPIVDLNLVNHFKKISISSTGVVSCSMDTDWLELTNCTIEGFSLSDYCSVKTLVYQDDYSEEKFDLAAMANLEHGAFYIRNCINYQFLGNLKSLDLSYCSSVTDVTCFRAIPKLRLAYCQNITDVSPLGGVFELDLTGNQELTDVSALGNVHSLTLSGCWKVSDVSALKSVHTLDISYSYRVTDVSQLTRVVVLNISGCQEVTNVTMLIGLQELTTRGCYNITDFSNLVHLRKLNLAGKMTLNAASFAVLARLSELSCDNLQLSKLDMEDDRGLNEGIQHSFDLTLSNFQFLSNIQHNSEQAPTDIQLFKTIPVLTFSRCNWLVEFPCFHHLRSLTITACSKFSSLSFLPVLGQLKIVDCDSLNSLDILGSPDLKYPVYNLQITGCKKLERVSFQRKVSVCSMAVCQRLEKLEIVEPIDLVKIRFCQNLRKVTNQAMIIRLDAAQSYHITGNDIEFARAYPWETQNEHD
jgi:hypothetical protein